MNRSHSAYERTGGGAPCRGRKASTPPRIESIPRSRPSKYGGVAESASTTGSQGGGGSTTREHESAYGAPPWARRPPPPPPPAHPRATRGWPGMRDEVAVALRRRHLELLGHRRRMRSRCRDLEPVSLRDRRGGAAELREFFDGFIDALRNVGCELHD